MNISVKNPLGIIALFVSFIDGISGLVISVNFEYMHGANERLPLIWFIVAFPFIVLIAFIALVIIKPQNLYGPRDFDNQELYLMALGKNLRPKEKPTKLMRPENIPIRRNKTSVCMSAFSYTNKNTQLSYIKDQEAALQKYSDDHDIDIKTEVQIDRNLICDGVAEKDGELYLFEVKVNFIPTNADNTIRKLSQISKKMVNNGCLNFNIVLILISTDELPLQIMDKLRHKADSFVHKLELVNYRREEIEKT